MFKASLFLFVAALLLVVCAPTLARSPQQGTPAPALAPATPASLPQATELKNPVKPTAESQANAKSLYQRDCALCHGDNGNGQTDVAKSMELTMDNWSNSGTLANKTDGALFTVVRNGKGKMPAEDAGRARDAEVWNLIIFIRKFAKNQPEPAAPVAPAPPTGLTGTPQ